MNSSCTPLPDSPVLAQLVEPAEPAVVLAEAVTAPAPILALAVTPLATPEAVPSPLAVSEAALVVPLAAEPVTAVLALKATPPGFHLLAFLARVWRGTCSACEWTFGAMTLLAGLAVLAVIPLAQFLCLGY